MNSTGKKIGLFGGTFDPVHLGHLIIADSVCESKNLDTVIFIPSASPPHKGSDIIFSIEDRFKMLSAAIEDNPKFTVSDIEMKRKTVSYTIDTIREMKTHLSPETELYFIVGMDNLYDLITWKAPREIVRESKILVAQRVCAHSREIPDWLKENIEMVDTPLVEISSSLIRRRMKDGKSLRYLVPDKVLHEIRNIKP